MFTCLRILRHPMVAVGIKSPWYQKVISINTKDSICYLPICVPVMSIFRDAKLKSDACSALHLESKSGGNAHGSIKSMAEFAPLVSLFCWWAPFSQCLCLTVSVCRLFFFLLIPCLQTSVTATKWFYTCASICSAGGHIDVLRFHKDVPVHVCVHCL